jgi:nucleotide-binding universal stress UspA family protein
MFQHVLLPTDLSEGARPALQVARDVARQNGARLTLLHVVQTIEHLPLRGLKGFYAQLKESAQDKLDRLSEATSFRDLDLHRKVVLGRTADAIVTFADRHRVDLIVMGSHPVDPKRPLHGFASVSHKVAILARCPVLLVK